MPGGSFQRAWSGVAFEWRTSYLTMAVAAVVGVVLGAWYRLWAVERVFFGASRQPPGDPRCQRALCAAHVDEANRPATSCMKTRAA